MESDAPIDLLVSREWNGTKWHYPNIERMVEENKRLRAELAAMRQQRDEARREVCKMVAMTRRKAGIRGQIVGLDRVTPAEIAAERGWDCFAQKEGGGA